jgi:hypothetical protein
MVKGKLIVNRASARKSVDAPAAPRPASSPFQFTAEELPVTRLLLDPNNYRFWDHRRFKRKVSNRFHEQKVQTATLENLEQNYQLDELKNSILVNGYVPMERIIVTPYPHSATKYVVIEGNRRVAALKSLIKDADEGVIALSAAQRDSLLKIPCAVLKSKGKDLRHAERVIMGIRHIAGPKEWGAYQQALLVAELKDDEALEFKEIGSMLGISFVEAARRYRAISALQYMEKDDLFGSSAQPDFYRLFHEMVSSPEIRDKFGWSQEANTFEDREAARQFFELISGSGSGDPKLKTYGDVRRLKIIVSNALAFESLLDPEQTFVEALRIAEENKVTTTPTAILSDAMRAISKIGVGQAKGLSKPDLALIDEIIDTLEGFKSLAKPKTKSR